MLPGEGEDLLQQLSGELGLPEFLDEVMLDHPDVLGVENIYDSFMDDLPSTDTKWLSDANIVTTDTANVFPPSPSNSDSSGTSSHHDPVMMSPSMLPLEVTPPVSPPGIGSNMINSSGTSFVSVPDLASLKLPIPKIQKPSNYSFVQDCLTLQKKEYNYFQNLQLLRPPPL